MSFMPVAVALASVITGIGIVHHSCPYVDVDYTKSTPYTDKPAKGYR